MFIPDWSWTDAEDIPAEGWTMIVSKRNFCYNARTIPPASLAGGTLLVPLDDLPSSYLRCRNDTPGNLPRRPLFIMDRETPPDSLLSIPFRPVLGHLNPDLLRAAMLGYHLVQWIANSRFCGRCGKEKHLSSPGKGPGLSGLRPGNLSTDLPGGDNRGQKGGQDPSCP